MRNREYSTKEIDKINFKQSIVSGRILNANIFMRLDKLSSYLAEICQLVEKDAIKTAQNGMDIYDSVIRTDIEDGIERLDARLYHNVSDEEQNADYIINSILESLLEIWDDAYKSV